MFKKGEIVICIDDRDNERLLTKGKEYVIIDPNVMENDFIEVVCDEGYVDMFLSTRFALSKSLSPKTLIHKMFKDYV